MPPIQDEQTKIFGYLPDVFNEFNWSERQTQFLKDNRDSVMAWIRESVSKNNRVGINFKLALFQINAKEMIPFLVKTYKLNRKDNDLLTVLMLLMKEEKYNAFAKSAIYKKLYGEESNYQDFILTTKANQESIIKWASDFYNGPKN